MIRRLLNDPRATAAAFALIVLGGAVQILILAGLAAGWWR